MLKTLDGLQQLRLEDGRTVACASPAEARMLWSEMSTAGFYRLTAALLRPGDIVRQDPSLRGTELPEI
ncbi:hypothetical protein [Nocardia arthritidis]|uniref:hypothetical protein n=1 Tax=Nocardia arthritidis TaxID=228602 RepID=UPI0007A48062|nr:hypothetical protein [Nocardia arthritidis]